MLIRKYDFAILAFTVGSLLIAGCGSGAQPKADVSGKVTMDGEPISGVSISFSSDAVGGGAFNVGTDGSFTSELPLTVGDYKISFGPPGPTPGETPGTMSFPDDESSKVPKAYHSGETSGLTATVTDDPEANVFTFDLSSKMKGRLAPGAGPPQSLPTKDRTAEPLPPADLQ